MTVDSRTPCVVGVATRTWHPDAVGEAGAPEPLDMWAEVARAAAADAHATGGPDAVGRALDRLDVVYCQTWQYDDPPGRLAARLGVAPAGRETSGIGGTTPQRLVGAAAERILAGDLDVALVVGAEALATKRAYKRRGARYPYSFAPDVRPPFPWDGPLDAAEVAHDVFQAWLTFALFDEARRARLGLAPVAYREVIGRTLAPLSEVAAANPDAWFRTARSAAEIVTPTPDNRIVATPYTKYAVAVMDVDQAAALVVCSHAAADALGVPAERRVYLRGWAGAQDPPLVAARPDLSRSPAMVAASRAALGAAGVGVDDVAHLDLYSCFASSVHFAEDALGLRPSDPRPRTVTGGLPYHGGPGSNYLSHSIATMVRVLREDPGAYGLVSGVGMHMTSHAFGVYSTTPGPVVPPDAAAIQAEAETSPPVPVVEGHDGPATAATASVVHGRDGAPESVVLVCDRGEGGRCYARSDAPDVIAVATEGELVGAVVQLEAAPVDLLTGGRGWRNSVVGVG